MVPFSLGLVILAWNLVHCSTSLDGGLFSCVKVGPESLPSGPSLIEQSIPYFFILIFFEIIVSKVSILIIFLILTYFSFSRRTIIGSMTPLIRSSWVHSSNFADFSSNL